MPVVPNQRPVFGPPRPPPNRVVNEQDAKRALEELWSLAESKESATSEKRIIDTQETESTNTILRSPQKAAATAVSPTKTTKTTTRQTPTCNSPTKSKPTASLVTKLSDANGHCQQKDPDEKASNCKTVDFLPLPETNEISFVVEEMPQICRFQLTLTMRNNKSKRQLSRDSIVVSAEPLGRSGSKTLVIVRENDATETKPTTRTLFVGEFPKPIRASEITWRIVANHTAPNTTGTTTESDHTLSNIVLRLPYPYDPSNTSSLVLGGSLQNSYGGSSCGNSTTTLDEINSVVCGACHLPLVAQGNNNHASDAAVPPKTKKAISRVFPLPLGHWDEIADYLICYDGQPVVDFSAGSECAEPSIALQDASLLCFHRKDVQDAVCALAVDGYGELTTESDDLEDENDDDLGSFFATKPASSSFVLPNPPPKDTVAAAATEEKKDDPQMANNNQNNNNNEPEISATSAVIRGDRTWQDAVDGDSVSLCCARCSSPLGFASLGSPETWRFWKHRLSIKISPPPPIPPQPTFRSSEDGISNSAETLSFATNTTMATAIPAEATEAKLLPRMPIMAALPVTKPLGSCSSFLARELVRYAESKAIFTFVVRREGMELSSNTKHSNTSSHGIPNDPNECLLLRLLSWETAMATSFDTKPNSRALLFRKVAKIVFEVTSDPTITRRPKQHGNNNNNTNTNNENGEGPTQWFWGGVDLCCPPPTASSNQNNNSTTSAFGQGDPPPDSVSTARLQLPNDEYNVVLEDLVSGKDLFEPEIAKATILLKMGGLSKGLGLTAVALQ